MTSGKSETCSARTPELAEEDLGVQPSHRWVGNGCTHKLLDKTPTFVVAHQVMRQKTCGFLGVDFTATPLSQMPHYLFQCLFPPDEATGAAPIDEVYVRIDEEYTVYGGYARAWAHERQSSKPEIGQVGDEVVSNTIPRRHQSRNAPIAEKTSQLSRSVR